MFSLTRSQIRGLRSVLRKAGIVKHSSHVGQNLFVKATRDRLRLRAMSFSSAVEFHVDGEFSPEEFSVGTECLAACEGKSDTPVTFERTAEDRLSVRWADKQIPQSIEYTTTPGGAPPTFPTRPEVVESNDPRCWSALLHAVGSTEAFRTRYALDCIQLRGNRGQIVGTDGREGLMQSGFHFPWAGDRLVPASAVLGCRDLAFNSPVHIGIVDDWMMFGVETWAIWLRIETEARYPDVDKVMASPSNATTRLVLAEHDAEFLLASLPKLPGDDGPRSPVTVELSDRIAVRAKSKQSQATELVLARSRLEGKPLTFTTNRDTLAKVVRLGFRDIYLFGAKSPAVCDDGSRQFVWALLDPAQAIPADSSILRIKSDAARSQNNAVPPPVRRPTVSETTPVTTETVPTPPVVKRPRRKGSTIEQVVALRDALKSVTLQANDVIRLLKQQKREAKIVQSTLDSLRQIQRIAS